MLRAGQLFRLTGEIVAIERYEDRMRVALIPTGDTVCMIEFPCAHDDRMADVLWHGKPVVMLGRDLRLRAEEVKAISARA